MKTLFLILIVLCSSSVYSQTTITGRVFDNDSKNPISGVVIYTHEKEKIVMTDENGNYIIEINSDDTVHFKQLAYNSISARGEALIKNSTVYLIPDIIELNEVVVSPIHVESLLKKSFEN
jgi:hypothetical protein